MDDLLLLGLAALAGTLSLWCPCGYSIAETVTRTVEGARRLRVRLILLVATTFSAATFGFALGLIGSSFEVGRVSPVVIGVAAVAALVADEIGRRWRPLKPLAVGKQVPREWGIVFPPEAASLLYGLRLGIAPLTILASWVWWVAIIVAAFYGPWFAALVGATFAVTRIFVSEVSTSRTTTESMAGRMCTVRRIERPLRATGALLLALAVTVMVINDTASTHREPERVVQR